MSERLQYPPLYLGIFFLLMIAITSVMFVVASPLTATLYTLCLGGVFGAGLVACRQAGEEQQARLHQLANALAVVALALCFVGLMIAGVETGLILLLITLQAGRNLVLHTRRDLNFACLISLVLILYTAGSAKDNYFILFIILYALAGMFTFMADHIDTRLMLAQGGDRQLLSRVQGLPAKGLALTILTLSLALAIYLFTPRLPSPHVKAMPSNSAWNYDNRQWQAEAAQPHVQGSEQASNGTGGERPVTAGAAGPSASLDITVTSAAIKGSNPILLNLQSDQPVYARAEVFDRFDGVHWSDSNLGIEKRFQPDGHFSFSAEQGLAETLQIYTIRHDLAPQILAAYQPTQLAFPGNVIETDAAMTMRVPYHLRSGTVYTVISHLKKVDHHPCSGFTTDEPEYAPYLTLYPDVSVRLLKLTWDITKQSDSNLSRAMAIETYLREHYAYTLDTAMVAWTQNPVEQFLFELKAGHCELFASSMTIMLRTIGIPARLVNGFYIQRYNPVIGYYEAKASDRHAWVEAYIAPHGWVTFEPTSSFELPKRTKRLMVAGNLLHYIDQNILELLRQHSNSLWVKILHNLWTMFEKLLLALMAALTMAQQLCMHFLYWLMNGGWLVILLATAICAAGVYVWHLYEPYWRLSKLRRAHAANPSQFPTCCYHEMERFFSLRSMPRMPQMTPLEYERLLVRRFASLAGQITFITDLFQQAAYGPAPLAAEDADAAYQAVEKLLHSKLPATRKRFCLCGRMKRQRA